MLKRIDPPGGVEVLSFKRNRGVVVLKRSDGKVLVREDGYVKEENIIDLSRAEKALKPVFKREFPRSRKVRISFLAEPEEAERQKKRL